MLELKHVSFRVENERGEEKGILRDVSLKISDRFVAVTGPNGGGKSTLAKVIAGIYQPTEGQILFNGEDITHKSITERARMGISYAFQQPVRFKGLTVRDLVSLAAGKTLSVTEVCAYLSEVGLCAREYVDREVNASLSGGELKRIERKLDARLSQLQDVRHAPLGEITLIHSPALRLFWIDTALTAPDYSALELSTSRLAAAQAEALVFLGKVGFSVSQEHLNEGSFGQYDGEFLVLDEADRFAGDIIDLPASLCAYVRFRGHHAESPAQYRRLMQFIREEGYTAAGFSREITVIDYGFTTDTEKFVTEIMIPLQKV